MKTLPTAADLINDADVVAIGRPDERTATVIERAGLVRPLVGPADAHDSGATAFWPRSANALAAVADLAAQRGADPGAIAVVGEENVTWPDSSIGCPVEGMAYMQVLTDGTRLVLELDGTRYEYHSGGSRATPFLCANPAPPANL